MEDSIKGNPSKFRRQNVFRIDAYSRYSFFFSFLTGRVFRVSNNANSFDTFEEELLKKVCISPNLMKLRFLPFVHQLRTTLLLNDVHTVPEVLNKFTRYSIMA